MIANLSYQANVAILTLNRPEAMNALNGEMIQRIGELIDEVHKSEAKALIVVGAGEKAFCAGADVKGILGKDLAQQKEFARKGQHVFAQLDQLSIPSIAVISGVAFGGGLELAMACTFRVATSKARMGLPEIKLGLIPGYGGTQRLPRLIGAARALEIISTGRVVGAEEAERIG
ncbi:MAG: enoyl-CoA hydratase/isomerase family protein, partial [Acidobacteriota bacterium]